jgi:hypothetical protein
MARSGNFVSARGIKPEHSKMERAGQGLPYKREDGDIPTQSG